MWLMIGLSDCGIIRFQAAAMLMETRLSNLATRWRPSNWLDEPLQPYAICSCEMAKITIRWVPALGRVRSPQADRNPHYTL